MKNPFVLFALQATACAFLLGACAYPPHYSLDSGDKWKGAPVLGPVDVGVFKDDAPREKAIHVRAGGATWRANGVPTYGKTDLSDDVTAAITKHLQYSGIFSKVAGPLPTGGQSPYQLTGRLFDYHAMAHAPLVSESVVILGTTVANIPGLLISLGLTSSVTTPYESRVELRDLKLTERATGNVVWQKDRIVVEKNGRTQYLFASPRGVCKLADKGLREAVNGMIQDIGRTVSPPASTPTSTGQTGNETSPATASAETASGGSSRG